MRCQFGMGFVYLVALFTQAKLQYVCLGLNNVLYQLCNAHLSIILKVYFENKLCNSSVTAIIMLYLPMRFKSYVVFVLHSSIIPEYL